MAKLREFISSVKKSGLARNNRYSICLPIMDGSGTEKLVAMYCDQVTLPSTNYSTTPYRAWGETREVVTEKVYENITLSVYVDSDMKVKSYFDNWMKMIQDPHTRTMGYYRDYARQLMINVEKITPSGEMVTNPDEGKKVYSIKLMECYPKTIGAIQLDYANKDVMKLNVTLTYKYWIKEEDSDTSYTFNQLIEKMYVPESMNFSTGIYSGLLTLR